MQQRARYRCIGWLCLVVLIGVALPGVAQVVAQSDPLPDQTSIYEPLPGDGLVEPPHPIDYYIAAEQARQQARLSQSPDAGTGSMFGVEVLAGNITNTTIRQRAATLGSNWVRMNGLSWRDIQPDPDTPPAAWNWDAESLQTFEADVQAVSALGMTPMVIVDDYPRWATIEPNACSEIQAEHFDAYARFLAELVTRYKDPPYNVRYWELGNEVDIDPRLVTPDNIFGCWGDIDDPYYNGESYGEMLKVVAPAMRTADPDVQILIGGLLLDRAETRIIGRGRPELFFEGILRAGAGESFDIVAFHSYPWYYGAGIDTDLTDDRWAGWGGMTVGKARYLRDIMQRYGVDKPLMLNEAAMLQRQQSQNEAFFEGQSNHLIRSAMRARAIDIQAFVWFTLERNGWLSAGLLDGNRTPLPPYHAYRTLIAQMGGVGPVDQVGVYGEPIEAYRANTGDFYVDVLWSRDATPDPVELPRPSFIAAYDRNGNQLEPTFTPTSVQFEVGYSPIYIHSTDVPLDELPTIAQVVPAEGLDSQPVQLTITGDHFDENPTVTLGSTSLLDVNRIDSSRIEAIVPPGLPIGSYNLVVTNPDGWTASRANAYTVLSSSPPRLDTIQPWAAREGFANLIHLYGANFRPGMQVSLGSTVLTPTRVSGSHVYVEFPARSIPRGVYDLTVTNPDQSSATLPAAYTVFATNQSTFDLTGEPAELWTDPLTIRAGVPFAPGQEVYRVGRRETVETEVQFQFSLDDTPAADLADLIDPAAADPDPVTIPLQPWFASASLPTVTVAQSGTLVITATIDPTQTYSETDETNNVITRTVQVLPPDLDTTAPVIDQFTINGGLSATTSPQVNLGLSVSDKGLGGGVVALYFVEYDYSIAANRWLVVQQSQIWQPYQSGQQPSWSLVPTPGIKYLRAWAVDRAGNVSAPALARINYLPSGTTPATLIETGAHVYRYQLSSDDRLTLRLQPTTGSMEVYVWAPDDDDTPRIFQATSEEYAVTLFATANGTHQIEVHGTSTQATYTLALERATTMLAEQPPIAAPAQTDTPSRSNPIINVDYLPGGNLALPQAPATPTSGSQLYLPLLRK